MSEKKNNSLLSEEEEAQVNGGLIAEASAAVPAEDLAAPALGNVAGSSCGKLRVVLRTSTGYLFDSDPSKNNGTL